MSHNHDFTVSMYNRDAMPHGMRATCPLCLREIKVYKDGTITRHGWKETGRQVGQIGLGFQWGECPGTRSRPLEQTDADAIKHLVQLREAAEKWEAIRDGHRTGHDYYDRAVKIRLDRGRQGFDYVFEAWAKSGLEVISDEEIKRPSTYNPHRLETYRQVTYRVPRGYAPEPKRSAYSTSYVKSYEELRQGHEAGAAQKAEAIREAEEALKAAIVHHRTHEPERKVEERKGPAVHMQRRRPGQAMCGSRAHYVRTTDKPEEVTCSRCRKSLGL